MTRAGVDAVLYAQREHANRSQDWTALCLKFVRTCLGVPSKYPSAEAAYYKTRLRRGTTSTPPVGVPVWWTNGRYGHVALSAGGGYVWSNDILRTGRIDKVSIKYITTRWGQTYRGWTEDINDVRVYEPPKPPSSKVFQRPENSKGEPVMSYSALRYAALEPRLSGWYWQYRHQAVGTLKALGFLPRDAPDTDFATGWHVLEVKIRRRDPNTTPDYYSFRWFCAKAGYDEPDGSNASGAPFVRPDWPDEP